MFKHSIFYRLLSNSWFLSWMVSSSTPDSKDLYSSSYIYRLTKTAGLFVLNTLHKIGDYLNQRQLAEFTINRLITLVGILMIFFGIFHIAGNRTPSSIIVDLSAALVGVVIIISRVRPGIWEGSWFLSAIRWWSRTD